MHDRTRPESSPATPPSPGPALTELDQLATDVGRLLDRIGIAPDRIDTRFARTAARHPARTATCDSDGEATYLELEWLADDVARRLEGRAEPGRPVAVRAARTRFAPAAVIGVLRAGVPCVPLDADDPADHQAYALEDSGAGLILTDCGLLEDEVPLLKAGPFVLASRLLYGADSGHEPASLPQGSAYVMHTADSGPEGRVVGHAQVLAHLDTAVPLVDTGPDDVWTLCHPLNADLSVWELWGPLLHGGRLVMADHEAATDPDQLARLLADRRVTVLSQRPDAFGQLAAATGDGRIRLPALRRVVLADGGSAAADVRSWQDGGTAPNAKVVALPDGAGLL
ncbi:AMP-binding protein [Streptomyces sp. NBC_01304]|uniref:AMP-binding protein n=1 Tax=Streptomyces sp. NBC_01304 TaxID=2903818 RepID=UPI002E1661AA|nr:AMP-binding protein [Streptomyces sp. NBC_01304]